MPRKRRNPDYKVSQSSGPVEINAKYFESIVPLSVKNAKIEEVGDSPFCPVNLGDAVPLPWFRRRKPRKFKPRFKQSLEPVQIKVEDFLTHMPPTKTPIPRVPSIGGSGDSLGDIDEELMNKTVNKMRIVLENRTVLH